jgi:hypothetical protein
MLRTEFASLHTVVDPPRQSHRGGRHKEGGCASADIRTSSIEFLRAHARGPARISERFDSRDGLTQRPLRPQICSRLSRRQGLSPSFSIRGISYR